MSRLDRTRDVLWGGVLAASAKLVAMGEGDNVVVLPGTTGHDWQTELHLAAQHDDDVSAVAAIDVLRILVARYDADQVAALDILPAEIGDRETESDIFCPYNCPGMIHELDMAERSNSLYWVADGGGAGFIQAVTGDGDGYHRDERHVTGFACDTCQRAVHLPAGVEDDITYG